MAFANFYPLATFEKAAALPWPLVNVPSSGPSTDEESYALGRAAMVLENAVIDFLIAEREAGRLSPVESQLASPAMATCWNRFIHEGNETDAVHIARWLRPGFRVLMCVAAEGVAGLLPFQPAQVWKNLCQSVEQHLQGSPPGWITPDRIFAGAKFSFDPGNKP